MAGHALWYFDLWLNQQRFSRMAGKASCSRIVYRISHAGVCPRRYLKTESIATAVSAASGQGFNFVHSSKSKLWSASLSSLSTLQCTCFLPFYIRVIPAKYDRVHVCMTRSFRTDLRACQQSPNFTICFRHCAAHGGASNRSAASSFFHNLNPTRWGRSSSTSSSGGQSSAFASPASATSQATPSIVNRLSRDKLALPNLKKMTVAKNDL